MDNCLLLTSNMPVFSSNMHACLFTAKYDIANHVNLMVGVLRRVGEYH